MPRDYIGIKPCGCLVFAAANEPRLARVIARQTAYCVKHGYDVRLMETEAIRQMPWRCAEHDKSKQSVMRLEV